MSPGPLLCVALVGLATALFSSRGAPKIGMAATLIGAAAALAAAAVVLSGGTEWTWRSGFAVAGEPLSLRLDAVSALFLALLGFVGGAGSVYAREYWPDRAHPRSARTGRFWWSVLILSVGWVLLSSNGLHFLIAWEIFALSSYFLITLDRPRRQVREAGWLYLAASHAATLCLFAFFAALAARTGSWELGPMRDQSGLAPLFWLALFAFGVKAGMFPLHIWLPAAHASAPSHVSALMSGLTIKIGIYGLVRFSGWLPAPAAAGWLVAALGGVSAVLGVAFALAQHDLKRLLAYHSVENIGIILLGLGFAMIAAGRGHAAWGALAFAGGLWHVWNHGLFKSLLFFGAGSVLHTTRTREISRLGGLWRRMPWTAGLFALGAAAISGLPPLNGFVSEWLVYLGLFAAVNSHGVAALAAVSAVVLMAMAGAMALACFIKVCGVVFLGAPRTAAAERARECGPLMRGPMLATAAACVAIGLAPALFWPALVRASAAWDPVWTGLGSAPALSRVGTANVALTLLGLAAVSLLWRRIRRGGLSLAPTWDCGFSAPGPRMQYTAGSFAGTLTEWFSWILDPRRRESRAVEAFPASASFEEHTPDTVLARAVEPAAARVMQFAVTARRFQHGRLQAYLLYLIAGLLGVTALVLTGVAS